MATTFYPFGKWIETSPTDEVGIGPFGTWWDADSFVVPDPKTLVLCTITDDILKDPVIDGECYCGTVMVWVPELVERRCMRTAMSYRECMYEVPRPTTGRDRNSGLRQQPG